MSIWISDPARVKVLLAFTFVVVLSACGTARFGKTHASRNDTPPVSSINVGGTPIAIVGPPGFCIDNRVSQTGGDTAFVVLGNCAVISPRTRAPSPALKALLTASVSQSGPGVNGVANSATGLDRFFRSENGRTALSRNSDPGTVEILDTFQQDGAFYLRARDTSPGIVPGASQDYWRSYFDLQGQVVSVSVIGFASAPLSPDKGLATTREFANLIRQKNGALETPVVAPVVVAQTQTQTPTQTSTTRPRTIARRSFWSLGLLRKLVN